MAKTARSITWCAAAFACGLVLAGCYPTPVYVPPTVPSGAAVVPIRLLSARGSFEQPPPYVMAATSLAILQSLIDAQYCPADRCRVNEWPPIAGISGEVLLALPVAAGDEIKSVVAWRAGSTIMVAEGLLQTCSGGECTAARQAMYLAAVPRAALPDGIVAFQVAGESTRSTVDLRAGGATPSG